MFFFLSCAGCFFNLCCPHPFFPLPVVFTVAMLASQPYNHYAFVVSDACKLFSIPYVTVIHDGTFMCQFVSSMLWWLCPVIVIASCELRCMLRVLFLLLLVLLTGSVLSVRVSKSQRQSFEYHHVDFIHCRLTQERQCRPLTHRC